MQPPTSTLQVIEHVGAGRPGHRGLRLAPLPQRRRVHGVHRLIPSEYSSGSLARRGHITKTGDAHLRTQLIESPWAYQHCPIVGTALGTRQADLPADTLARSWTAQLRLCRRFRALPPARIKGVGSPRSPANPPDSSGPK
ncbi:hypothetical protein GCM10023215_31440 [Pseudonocardia yuanmonensis]|uniref:Transposase IS116/IS110/IS902 C-terminal domain-containing protein n=1 Tax=Pseudonocardia yuanmonensis TaxID=1095914 RepID=A0ABP8WLZ3_9PSEU